MTTEPATPVRGKRVKYILIVASLALSALTLVAWTQTWLDVQLVEGSATAAVTVDGNTAAPALAALALAGLALTAALAIAGVLFRILLGVLDAVLGVCIALSAILVLTSPIGASEAAVTTATGIAGSSSIADIVSATSLTIWPILTLLFGILLALTGVAIAISGRGWPSSSRKYSAVRLEPVDGDAMPDSVDSWDDLTRGDDPTR
ncbi:putative membrane protein (TIGR02234 family) [Mycetocola sp. CAN_C7]|uniref:Trp biosynthesis-associated membrane protein n=1 Tax=Mycetocola sp. CAN_C7 TaxID=2787724 RepID=UPI0018C8DC73